MEARENIRVVQVLCTAVVVYRELDEFGCLSWSTNKQSDPAVSGLPLCLKLVQFVRLRMSVAFHLRSFTSYSDGLGY